jgi:hypothetical protein
MQVERKTRKMSMLPGSLPTFLLEEEADHSSEKENSVQCTM